MRKVHAALKPAGRAAIAELVPNPDRVTPPTATAFSMMMLATTPAGDAYTFSELGTISKSAGFARELSSRCRRSASIAWSLRTGELRTERWPLRGLHLTRLPFHDDTGE